MAIGFDHSVILPWSKWTLLCHYEAGLGYMIRPELFAWLKQQVGSQYADSDYLVELNSANGMWCVVCTDQQVEVQFVNLADALLFKLTWL